MNLLTSLGLCETEKQDRDVLTNLRAKARWYSGEARGVSNPEQAAEDYLMAALEKVVQAANKRGGTIDPALAVKIGTDRMKQLQRGQHRYAKRRRYLDSEDYATRGQEHQNLADVVAVDAYKADESDRDGFTGVSPEEIARRIVRAVPEDRRPVLVEMLYPTDATVEAVEKRANKTPIVLDFVRATGLPRSEVVEAVEEIRRLVRDTWLQ